MPVVCLPGEPGRGADRLRGAGPAGDPAARRRRAGVPAQRAGAPAGDRLVAGGAARVPPGARRRAARRRVHGAAAAPVGRTPSPGSAEANGLLVLGERVTTAAAGSTVDVLLLDRQAVNAHRHRARLASRSWPTGRCCCGRTGARDAAAWSEVRRANETGWRRGSRRRPGAGTSSTRRPPTAASTATSAASARARREHAVRGLPAETAGSGWSATSTSATSCGGRSARRTSATGSTRRVAGRGVIPTALALAVDHAFGPAGCTASRSTSGRRTSRRRRVVEKLGFREEAYHPRYMHIDGAWRDHIGYAMTSEEVAAEGGLLARWHRLRAAPRRSRRVDASHGRSAHRAAVRAVTSADWNVGTSRRSGRSGSGAESVTGGVRVPTSVLLAVLAAAGLLALAPALVRRYDATERLVAERAHVDGAGAAAPPPAPHRARTPPDPSRPRSLSSPLADRAPVSAPPVSAPPAAAARRLRAVPPSAARRRRPPQRRPRRATAAAGCSPPCCCSTSSSWSACCRRRPGLLGRRRGDRDRCWWCTSSTCGTRPWPTAAPAAREAREAAWLAARQAEVRREQARRAAARREAQRRLAAQREAVRRAAMGLDRPYDLPPAAIGVGVVPPGRWAAGALVRGRTGYVAHGLTAGRFAAWWAYLLALSPAVRV